MELSLRYFWAAFLFFLAFLNLSSQLANRAVQSSALPIDLQFNIYTEDSSSSFGTTIYEDCQGLWSCASTICRLVKMTNIGYLFIQTTAESSNQCGISGLSWITRSHIGQATIAMLIISIFLQGIGLMIFRLPRIYFCIALFSANGFLILAHILGLIWSHHDLLKNADQQPGMITAWSVSLSIFLVIGTVVANLSLIPNKPETYEPINN
jgi:hypothetical protein